MCALVTGVQTCALPISPRRGRGDAGAMSAGTPGGRYAGLALPAGAAIMGPATIQGGKPWDSSRPYRSALDRKSVVKGQSVSVRVDLGGRRNIKTKNNT